MVVGICGGAKGLGVTCATGVTGATGSCTVLHGAHAKQWSHEQARQYQRIPTNTWRHESQENAP